MIPVFNSERLVEKTIDQVTDFFEHLALPYEIILVNDGSTDSSWSIIKRKAQDSPNIVAIDLLKNYGQHNANFCGFQESRGDYLITLDDDLQNPPAEIAHLISKAEEGHDVVFARFQTKRHPIYRRAGTKVIDWMNRKIFRKPKDLVLSNFRLISRDVVLRVCKYKTAYPYIPGLLLLFSRNPGNVVTAHHKRASGKSNYTFKKLAALVAYILFNYSSYPLRIVAALGFLVSSASFLLGMYYVLLALFSEVNVKGWTTVVVLISFFNGVSLLILGMLGEYLVRLINQTSGVGAYQVREVVRSDA